MSPMSQPPNPDVLILGAGMAGLATAYHLAVKRGITNILIVDERPPLGLTSSRGTMAYRNWFPGPGDAMVRLMNRSIELLREIDTESNHRLELSQNGYIYLTAQPSQIAQWRSIAREAEQRGVGAFREHDDAQSYIVSPASDWRAMPDGTDLITSADVVRQLYPSLTANVAGLLHVRRCGAFNGLYLGRWLLDQACAHGAQLWQDTVEQIETRGGRIKAIQLASGAEISTDTLVVAAGPLLPNVARMLELGLPIYSELHAKITLDDTARVFPRYGDLMYWNDPQTLDWGDAPRVGTLDAEETNWLRAEFPGGVHYLPKGSDDSPKIMGLWTYDMHEAPYADEPTFEPHYADIILRGLARMIPEARIYFGHAQEAKVDGGYYCKTRENRPLIGPAPVQGAYIIGALSGFGVMASQGAADLVSAHVAGESLPKYARWFMLERYEDTAYRALLKNWDAHSGQL